MPLLRRNTAIPDSCTLAEAYLWIAKDIPPGSVSLRLTSVAERESVAVVTMLHPDLIDRVALAQLQERFTNGDFQAWGNPKIKSGSPLDEEKWGDAVEIPTAHITRAYIDPKALRTSRIVAPRNTSGQKVPLREDVPQGVRLIDVDGVYCTYDGVRIPTEALFNVFPSLTGWEMKLLHGQSSDCQSAGGYSTTLLKVLDAIREKIAADDDPNSWTREAIEAECQAMLPPGCSGRDTEAIATVLMPDAKRWKWKKLGDTQ